jgi:hypothetical protein
MSRSARKSRDRSLPSRPNRTPQSGKTIRSSTSIPSHRIALANAEAQLGIARDQANILIATYRSRLKQIEAAGATLDHAQTNYERHQHLSDTGAAPRSTLDAAIATCRPQRPIWQACDQRLRQRWPNSAAVLFRGGPEPLPGITGTSHALASWVPMPGLDSSTS